MIKQSRTALSTLSCFTLLGAACTGSTEVRSNRADAAVIAAGPRGAAQDPQPEATLAMQDALGRTVGVVDLQHAIRSTRDGLRVQAELRRIFEARQLELTDRSGAIEAEMRAIERLPTGQEAKRRSAALQSRVRELQEFQISFQRELSDREAAAIGPLVAKMRTILAEVAARRGLRFVFDRQSMPVAPTENDITEDVIQAYDATTK